ncbi:hypothetical protein D1007_43331 [Hordeum vulgare]|nr:hypothetical protein D1007_43331 [Hordeum vulgare]
MLPWTVAESSEHGWTLISPGATAKWPASKAVYPFFLHSVFAGLVPPFSSFFTDILNHYGIQALQLQPNPILLMSVFAFYCEAFVGVRPSVALFRHFFSLRLHDGAHLSASISFIAAQGGNLLLKAGKKLGDDKLGLQSQELPTEEMNRVVVTLLGGDPCDLPEALGLLYCLDDRADLIAALPVFDERGIFVQKDDTSGWEDSEKTVDDCPASAPLPSRAILLRRA